MKLTLEEIEGIGRLWFAKSRPYLSPNANEAEFLDHFYRQLKLARFTGVALESAIKRARKIETTIHRCTRR